MILMYHHVVPADRPPAEPEAGEGWQFAHTPEGFERQLNAMRARGFDLIGLDAYVAEIESTGREPRRAAVVTFDDGWIDNHDFALPILRKLGVPATFFVTTNGWDAGGAKGRMSPAQWRELRAQGMLIGGHTRTHPDLTRVSLADAKTEIAGCKADLESALCETVDFFAYPGGAFNRAVAEVARVAGWRAACSVLGPARNTRESLFHLYRDTLTESMDSWRDAYRLSPLARRAMEFRVLGKARRAIES